ncbi:DNA polymerase I [Patescibacteria group bacterium]|nr:DNA polymerase I [Patescibacteria group bacterium]
MKRLLIIDGNAIIHRAYHALPPLTNKQGKMVNAVYGFTSMLLKVWHDLKPTHIAVTFDVAGGTFRHEKCKKYKATRVKADQELYDQIPLVHEVVGAFNIPIYEKKGFEADDVIGTIVSRVAQHVIASEAKQSQDKTEVFIVTGDMDTLQLIQPGVKVYTLRKGMSDVVIYDAEGVKKRFGFGPEMLVDYKALRGDASDNISGVPGIGEKTAGELIQKVGGIDEIYKQLIKNKEQLTKKVKAGVIKKLEEGEERARMSFELATIDTNVPDLHFKLGECELKPIDREKIDKLFQELEFVSLIKRIPGMEGEKLQINPKRQTSKPVIKDLRVIEVKYPETVQQIYDLIQEKEVFACKAVMSGEDVFADKLIGVCFEADHKAFWVPAEFMTDLWKVFRDPHLELVGHNLKQMIKIIACHCEDSVITEEESARPVSLRGAERRSNPSEEKKRRVQMKPAMIVKNKLFDVMIASYLLNPGSRAHSASDVILKVLGKELPAGSSQSSLFGVNTQAVANELYLISRTVEKLKKELEDTEDLGLMDKLEMPLIHVLAEMELNGIAVDTEMLSKLSKEAAAEIKKVSQKIYKMAGKEFNISSPIQLREILFDKLEIPVEGIKKGKTGLSTGAEQLEKMRGLHPIIELIETYREISKLQNTYIDVLPTLINKVTGRIHTTFNQAVTATGRLSSSDPNIQNIPIRTELGREIRKAFIAEEGFVLVAADYSQIELRIVASLAEDKKMMEIFDKDEDIHKATASAIHDVALDKVTKEMRRSAKEVNFGVLYGMGAYGLAWRAGIPQEQAREFIKKYFDEFAGVKKYIDRTLEFTKKEGYCETLFGRRRYIPELKAQNYQLRAAAERMAVNHPIQGTAADLIKMAMIEVHNVIARSEATKQSHEKGDIKLLLQVHDELVFEVKKGLEEKVGKIVKEAMEGVVKLRVPIRVDVHQGKRWGEIK